MMTLIVVMIMITIMIMIVVIMMILIMVIILLIMMVIILIMMITHLNITKTTTRGQVKSHVGVRQYACYINVITASWCASGMNRA